MYRATSKSIFFLICLAITPLFSEIPKLAETKPPSKILSSIEQYLQLLNTQGSSLVPLGSWRGGEIEIIIDIDKIKTIENQMRLRLQSKGATEQEAKNWSTVGIVAEDNYLIWIRDGVIFPSGVYGTYDRLIWKSGLDGAPGVAIIPVLANKKIIVNLNYRHATRSWEIELPRGEKRPGESVEQAALRELKEETGYQLSKSIFLGTMAPDSGILATIIPLFYGEVSHFGETYREYSEAISQNPAFTKQELKEGLSRGYIEMPIQGNIIRAYCRDPHLAFAILQAESKELL